MIKLEITVQPKSEKFLEFSQSLDSIKPELELLCSSLQVTEMQNTFTITLDMDSVQELTTALRSKELGILSGAIHMLTEKSEVIIQGIGHKRKGSDLRKIRLNYLKKNN
ncbi:MAG: hypothetical protein GXO86_02915 [Chlorobi bacterium]|nr:hypothetical protein [Chlorobiota bacterium]